MTARRRNRTGAERTLAALRAGGRLESADAGNVAVVRHLAWALDVVDPVEYPAQTASLARAQLAALKLLRGLDDGDAGESLDAFLAGMRAEVGDAPES